MNFQEAIAELNQLNIPLTDSQITKLWNKAVSDMEALGPDFKIDWTILSYKDSYEASGALGNTRILLKNGKIAQEISFNRNMFREGLEDIILNTMYHELCHYFQNMEAFNSGFFRIIDGNLNTKNDKEAYDYFMGNDGGHAKSWFNYVDKVNNIIKPKILITAHPNNEEMNVYYKANADRLLFTIDCDNCGASNKFLSFTSVDFETIWINFPGLLTKLIKTTRDNTPNNMCKACNKQGNLRIHFMRDKDKLIKKMLEADKMALGLSFFRMLRFSA